MQHPSLHKSQYDSRLSSTTKIRPGSRDRTGQWLHRKAAGRYMDYKRLTGKSVCLRIDIGKSEHEVPDISCVLNAYSGAAFPKPRPADADWSTDIPTWDGDVPCNCLYCGPVMQVGRRAYQPWSAVCLAAHISMVSGAGWQGMW